MATIAGGRNTRVENFVATDTPTAMPNSPALPTPGWSITRWSASNANRNVATNPMSVVARPECATIGGSVATDALARNATHGSDLPPASSQVKRIHAKKIANSLSAPRSRFECIAAFDRRSSPPRAWRPFLFRQQFGPAQIGNDGESDPRKRWIFCLKRVAPTLQKFEACCNVRTLVPCMGQSIVRSNDRSCGRKSDDHDRKYRVQAAYGPSHCKKLGHARTPRATQTIALRLRPYKPKLKVAWVNNPRSELWESESRLMSAMRSIAAVRSNDQG
jgi:hypothetical protein